MALRPDGIEERLCAASQHVSGGRGRRRLKKRVFSDGPADWMGWGVSAGAMGGKGEGGGI